METSHPKIAGAARRSAKHAQLVTTRTRVTNASKFLITAPKSM
jgi:hypothetical protein